MHQFKSSPITSSTVTSIWVWNLLKPAMNSCHFPSQHFFILVCDKIYLNFCDSLYHWHSCNLSQKLVKLRSYNWCFISHTILQNNADFYLILMKLPFSSSHHGYEYPYKSYAVLHIQSCVNSEFQILNTVKLCTVNFNLANKLFQSSETQTIVFIFFWLLLNVICNILLIPNL